MHARSLQYRTAVEQFGVSTGYITYSELVENFSHPPIHPLTLPPNSSQSRASTVPFIHPQTMPPPPPPIGRTNHPVDGGWAWVICAAAAVANFFVTGGVRSIGVMSVELIRYFDPNPIVVQFVTALIGANFAIFSFAGNILGLRFSMPRVALVGAVITVIGKLMCVFAPNMGIIVFGLGATAGMGYGLMFGPSMVLVGQYFNKRRALANGLAIAGGSIGQLALPWFITGAVNGFAFRGGMLIYVALALHAIPAMCLLRAPSFYGPAPVQPVADKDIGDRLEGQTRESPAAGGMNSSVRKDSKVSLMEQLSQKRLSVASLTNHPAQSTSAASTEDATSHHRVKPEAVKPAMQKRRLLAQLICDSSLVCDPVFVAFVLGLSIGHSGYMSTCFFLPLYTNQLWGSESLNASVVSIMGVADLLGRVLGGVIADLNLMPKPHLVAISFLVCGILTLMMPFVQAIGIVIVYTILVGMVGGSYMAMMVVLIVDLFGEQKLPQGLGLTTLAMGLLIIPFPPVLAGAAKVSGYALSMRLAGLLMLVGSISFFIIMPIHRHRSCRQIPDTVDKSVQTVAIDAGKRVAVKSTGSLSDATGTSTADGGTRRPSRSKVVDADVTDVNS